jgi:hypothetical protein
LGAQRRAGEGQKGGYPKQMRRFHALSIFSGWLRFQPNAGRQRPGAVNPANCAGKFRRSCRERARLQSMAQLEPANHFSAAREAVTASQ